MHQLLELSERASVAAWRAAQRLDRLAVVEHAHIPAVHMHMHHTHVTRTYTYTYTYTYMRTAKRTRMSHAHLHITWAFTCHMPEWHVHAHGHAHAHAYIHAHVYGHVHVHLHVHIPTYICMVRFIGTCMCTCPDPSEGTHARLSASCELASPQLA